MPKLDLINAKQIKTGGGEILQLKGPGFSWTKPVVIPVINIQSGSGYAGSVYSSTASGSWTANGVEIPNSTGNTFTMTPQYEGSVIQCNGSNSIKMWTPNDLSVSIRCFWFDMRRAELIDNRINSVTDNWSSSLVATAPDAASRPLTGLVNGQLTAYRADGQYIDNNRRLVVPPVSGIAEIILAYRTPSSYGSTFPWNDHVLLGSETSNTWRRIRTTKDSTSFSTEGIGTIVNESGVNAGVSPYMQAAYWRTTTLTTGISLWARAVAGSNGGIAGNQAQAIALNRQTTTSEKRLISAYIAWVHGNPEGLSVDNPYRNSPPINV